VFTANRQMFVGAVLVTATTLVCLLAPYCIPYK